MGTEINSPFLLLGMIQKKGRGVGEGCILKSRENVERKRDGIQSEGEEKTKRRKKSEAEVNRKENVRKAKFLAGSGFSPKAQQYRSVISVPRAEKQECLFPLAPFCSCSGFSSPALFFLLTSSC